MNNLIQVELILKDSSLSDKQKLKAIEDCVSMKYITDNGLGYLVRLPNKRSRFFRYKLTKSEQSKDKQLVACRKALTKAKEYKYESLNKTEQ